MFSDFDFKLLDDPSFKEDSVREELVFPILKWLGYSASGEDKIVRSKALTHPYVYIGSKKHPISIIPDYLLSTSGGETWILDAKAPDQNILKGKNPEQAFSYAIHPDIRAKYYALCNGRQFVAFHISKVEPVICIDIDGSPTHLDSLRKLLAPKYLKHPDLANYQPDYGVHMLKAGWDMAIEHYWYGIGIGEISKISDDMYTTSIDKQFFNNWYCVSLDFGPQQLEQLLGLTSEHQRTKILNSLGLRPFSATFDESPIAIGLHASFSEKKYSSENGSEDFIPLQVHSFFRTTDANPSPEQ
ncbi:MAG: hypothetical protein WCV99_01520 [Sterolibacterium sp.]|jgi:hypothetical protein